MEQQRGRKSVLNMLICLWQHNNINIICIYCSVSASTNELSTNETATTDT